MSKPSFQIVNGLGELEIPQAIAAPLLAEGGGPPHDGGVEARVAKLEVTVQYIQRDVAEIKNDLRATNQAITKFGTEVNSEFKAVRSEAKTDFRMLFGAIITAALGLAALMAKGFHWI